MNLTEREREHIEKLRAQAAWDRGYNRAISDVAAGLEGETRQWAVKLLRPIHPSQWDDDEARRGGVTMDDLQMEWRWVDGDGRAMTAWQTGNPPPVFDLKDEKGTMHVQARLRGEGQT